MSNAVADIHIADLHSQPGASPDTDTLRAAKEYLSADNRRSTGWLATPSETQEGIDTGPSDVSLYRALGQGVSALRWMTAVMLLLLTMVQPRMGKVGLLNWQLVVIFLIYNAVAELLLGKLPGRRALYWKVIIDLPAAGAVYFCSATPGSPQFDLIFMAVLCATITMPLPRSLIYTAAAIGMAAIIEPTLPNWQPTNDFVRELGARMLLLALTGTGTAIITRRLAIEQQHSHSARKEAQRLGEIDRMREDFISTITHDLRTPYTAVRAGLGMVEVSVSDRLRPEEIHLLSSVRRNSDRLGIMINDLLAFTQFEAGALRLDMQPLDLGDIVANAALTLEPLTHEKNQTLRVNVESVLPHTGDKRKLEQVVINLLDNAHRHTPPGTCIAVHGYLRGDEVRLVIQDDGPGIPPQECEAIFERFHRADVKEGGWGLGLTIAQAITEKHGGRIWVESKLGDGAAFHIALPSNGEAVLDGGATQ